jgi:pentapeptide MXKDX repeat protein
MHADCGIDRLTNYDSSAKGNLIMKRTMAAILNSLVLVVGFIGCSGTATPKTGASGDSMKKVDGMTKDGMMKEGMAKDSMMKEGMQGEGKMKGDGMMKGEDMKGDPK